mgnify:CR=1 FL=1|jgi:hypothetical protein
MRGEKMRIKCLLVLLVTILVSSCAAQEPAPIETPPAAPVETPPVEPVPPVEEPTEVIEPEEEEKDVTEVEVMYAGYEPKELTVAKGTVLSFKSIQGKHKLTLNGKGQDVIEEEGAIEYTADAVGDIRVFDIFTKKSMVIKVVEELPEEEEMAEETTE